MEANLFSITKMSDDFDHDRRMTSIKINSWLKTTDADYVNVVVLF